ncbi:MAG: hypothetical protein AAF269_05670 [Pseudomonadota bacterium]
MIKTHILPILCLFAMACTASDPTMLAAADGPIPVNPDPDPRATIEPVSKKEKKTRCPSKVSVSAYRNLMPGPGYNPSKVPASIQVSVEEDGNWAIAYKPGKAENAILLKLFPTVSKHVKPPARPVWQRSLHKPMSDEGRTTFRIVRPGARSVEIWCGSEMIAQAPIRAVR